MTDVICNALRIFWVLFAAGMVVGLIRRALRRASNKKSCRSALWHNFKQLLIAVDQLAHIVIFIICAPFKRHYADETLSSHCWRLDKDGVCKWPRRIIDLLLFFDPDHCKESYESERLGRQLPPECRINTQGADDE